LHANFIKKKKKGKLKWLVVGSHLKVEKFKLWGKGHNGGLMALDPLTMNHIRHSFRKHVKYIYGSNLVLFS